jgi:hypothetical protein
MSDFRDQPWFHSMEQEASGRFVVYVKYMDKEVLTGVPDTIDDKQVVIHFVGAKLATREMFTNNPSMRPSFVSSEPIVTPVLLPDEADKINEVDELTSSTDEDKSLSYLIAELDKLERQCGSNTLQDIFYEIHDGINAVTEWSKRYPDVRKTLENLYQEYGFDVIYEEMDG